jgi:hypothetical protein
VPGILLDDREQGARQEWAGEWCAL